MYDADPKLQARVSLTFTEDPTVSPEQMDRCRTVRHHFREAAFMLLKLTPPGREQSSALTALEESMMWAMSAIRQEERKP